MHKLVIIGIATFLSTARPLLADEPPHIFFDDPSSRAYMEFAQNSAECLAVTTGVLPDLYQYVEAFADVGLMKILADRMTRQVFSELAQGDGRLYELQFEYGKQYSKEGVAEDGLLHLFLASMFYSRLQNAVDIGDVPRQHVKLFTERVENSFMRGVGFAMAGDHSSVHSRYQECLVNLEEFQELHGSSESSFGDESWFVEFLERLDEIMIREMRGELPKLR